MVGGGGQVRWPQRGNKRWRVRERERECLNVGRRVWVREFIEVEACNRSGHGKSQGKSKKVRGREVVERDLALL